MKSQNGVLMMSVHEFCEKYYFPDCSYRLRNNTLLSYQYTYKNHVMPYFADMRLCDVAPIDIRKWQNQLIADGYKDTYLKKLHAFLSRIFDYALRYFKLAQNPCVLAGSIGRHCSNSKCEIWTLEEFSRIVDAIPEIEFKTQVSLLFWSGIRRGELYGLQWQDFDNKTGELRIARNYQRIKGEMVIHLPKTEAGIRTITLPRAMCEMLVNYRNSCRASCNKDFIFVWTKRKLEQAIANACKITDVKRIRVHDLRHSHASLLINMNQDIASISKRLGHSSISMTLDTYTHVYESADTKIANALDRLLQDSACSRSA